MKTRISLVMITKNAPTKILRKSLQSVSRLVNEIVIVDDYSTNGTVNIAKKNGARIYFHHEKDLGKQKSYAINKSRNKWILLLDSDEVLSKQLITEIKNLKLKKIQHSGFNVPFKNHFLGKPIKYGGENYKMLRLFRKDHISISATLVHENIKLKIGRKSTFLINKIYHYSYRSIWQMFIKFTDYAIREAKQKRLNSEKSSIKKIFLYPLHMFWARFIEDKGYKDGLFRIPLDLGFAYMEFLAYLLMLFI